MRSSAKPRWSCRWAGPRTVHGVLTARSSCTFTHSPFYPPWPDTASSSLLAQSVPLHTRHVLLPGLARRPHCSLIVYLYTLATSSSLA